MTHQVKHSIECWIFDRNKERFLLLKCPETDRHKEYWQPVTGGIEKGEDRLSACLREIREETGAVLEPADVKLLLEAFRVYSDERDLHKTVFLTETPGLDVILSDEHTDFTWADPSEVMTLLLWGSNRVTFQRVMDYLDTRPL
jgi:dATP pyrophosphohydrolase